jgi:hypothetical protein
VAVGRLLLWSAVSGEWAACRPDEITWLDREMLSGNEDVTLHRAPRCAGLRYVHHRWELFSRDTTYRVYLAPYREGVPQTAEEVQRAARHVLPVAPAQYEALPIVLEPGTWLVSVAAWVLPLRLEVPAQRPAPDPRPGGPQDRPGPVTQNARVGPVQGRSHPARGEAADRVRGYFERNVTARMAMAYYYQEFILGLPAAQALPMMDVVIALDLSGEGAVSDYKKLLQGLIWNERGHARDIPEFLLANGLLTPADRDQARQIAADNERRGVCETARRRLQYRPKGT